MDQEPSAEPLGNGAPTCRYFTDGANLYRFVGWLSRSIGERLAELEDCRSLDVLLISARELSGGGTLHQVR